MDESEDGGLSLSIFIERQGRNNFTRVEGAVTTARALKEKGLDKDAIDVAIERTRTHVGTADLSAEQWLSIALGYLPGARCPAATSAFG